MIHAPMILVPKNRVPNILVAGKFTLSLAYSADGKYLASGAIDGIIAVFDMEQRKLLHTLEVNKSKLIYVEIRVMALFVQKIYLGNHSLKPNPGTCHANPVPRVQSR